MLERRACGCPFGELGFDLHLHTIRSYEKLTSEGMNFLGHDLIRLIEEVLPARFGGEPTDYQFVEDEDDDGLPGARCVVSPRVGELNEAAVVAAVVDFLNRTPGAGGAWRALARGRARFASCAASPTPRSPARSWRSALRRSARRAAAVRGGV